MTIRWHAAGVSHVGKVRKGNEDAFRIDEESGVFIVADGMGGHAAGEIASALAADVALERLSGAADLDDDRLRGVIDAAFASAHQALVECCEGDPKTAGMGTTLTVALLRPDRSLLLGHLGDSRLYHLSAGALRQLSRDHTWVQQEVDAGRVAPNAARKHPFSHILSRVLSVDESAAPDISRFTVNAGDTLLLCSDGLHNLVEASEILDILMSADPIPDAAKRLIGAANRRGGTDNITAVVVRVEEASGRGRP